MRPGCGSTRKNRTKISKTLRIMATKQIPFSLEMVKKIQAGEVKGIIRTRGGSTARFLGEIKHPEYPLVFVKKSRQNDEELLETYTLTGKYYAGFNRNQNDIILEMEMNEEEKQEHQFKPFDKVLVRDADIQKWKCALFSHNTNDKHGFVASALYWEQCIPYEGNEHLVGTTDKPKED